MAQYEISCPHHGKIETITVPDSYGQHNFEGEVRCGDAEESKPIKIKIVRENIVQVERA